MTWKRAVPLFALFVVTLLAAVAAGAEEVVVSSEWLSSAPILLESWQFLPEPALASGQALTPPSLSEPGWVPAATLLDRDAMPAGWSGVGWFALELSVVADAVDRLLGLTLTRHYGASRVFLDQELLSEVGVLSDDSRSLRPEMRPDPIFFLVNDPGRHQLSVLFANPDLDRYHRVGYPGGFAARLEPATNASARARLNERDVANRRALFTSVFLAFALLHLLLFLFRPKSLENLYFASLCISLAILVFLLLHKQLVVDPRIVFWSESTMNVAGLGFAILGVLFTHRVFTTRVPRVVGYAIVGVVLLFPWVSLRPADWVAVVFLVMLLGLAEMARCVLFAVGAGRPGARIIGLGILVLALGFGCGLLANLSLLPRSTAFTFFAPFLSMLFLIVTMSVYLSRRYALTQRELEDQLQRVRQLSEERLNQERREREHELSTKLLEAEVARRDQELEEARRLQLSMLPQSIPSHELVELAAHMSTATEVGGDYYDFDLSETGALTIAVGDATGHGLRAGTMVTATKSLFNALGGDPDMVEIVERSNLAIKRMNLRNLNMALLLARFERGRLRVTAAGMPQPLVYRSQNGTVEALKIEGMPLGAMRSYPYRAVETQLASRDVVLFLSDGLPERRSADGDLLGYDAVAERFRHAAELPVAGMIQRLVELGDTWASGVAAEDDITLVVMKVRQARGRPAG